MSVRIFCVLKSGGDYNTHYVAKLHDDIQRIAGDADYEFFCLSDLMIPGFKCFTLETPLEGWWAKLELFKYHGPVLYFDLDTIILRPFGQLLELAENAGDDFYMLEAFNPSRKFASGIMAWDGDWSWLFNSTLSKWDNFYMEQDAIVEALEETGRTVKPILRGEHKIVSYKHHCKKGVPMDSSIICFHGRPRPHQVPELWMN